MPTENEIYWDNWVAEHTHPELAKIVLDWLVLHDCEELYLAANSIVDLILMAEQRA